MACTGFSEVGLTGGDSKFPLTDVSRGMTFYGGDGGKCTILLRRGCITGVIEAM